MAVTRSASNSSANANANANKQQGFMNQVPGEIALHIFRCVCVGLCTPFSSLSHACVYSYPMRGFGGCSLQTELHWASSGVRVAVCPLCRWPCVLNSSMGNGTWALFIGGCRNARVGLHFPGSVLCQCNVNA